VSHCGKAFQPSRSDNVYCSDACRTATYQARSGYRFKYKPRRGYVDWSPNTKTREFISDIEVVITTTRITFR
jgi:hypothetical protein